MYYILKQTFSCSTRYNNYMKVKKWVQSNNLNDQIFISNSQWLHGYSIHQIRKYNNQWFLLLGWGSLPRVWDYISEGCSLLNQLCESILGLKKLGQYCGTYKKFKCVLRKTLICNMGICSINHKPAPALSCQNKHVQGLLALPGHIDE